MAVDPQLPPHRETGDGEPAQDVNLLTQAILALRSAPSGAAAVEPWHVVGTDGEPQLFGGGNTGMWENATFAFRRRGDLLDVYWSGAFPGTDYPDDGSYGPLTGEAAAYGKAGLGYPLIDLYPGSTPGYVFANPSPALLDAIPSLGTRDYINNPEFTGSGDLDDVRYIPAPGGPGTGDYVRLPSKSLVQGEPGYNADNPNQSSKIPFRLPVGYRPARWTAAYRHGSLNNGATAMMWVQPNGWVGLDPLYPPNPTVISTFPLALTTDDSPEEGSPDGQIIPDLQAAIGEAQDQIAALRQQLPGGARTLVPGGSYREGELAYIEFAGRTYFGILTEPVEVPDGELTDVAYQQTLAMIFSTKFRLLASEAVVQANPGTELGANQMVLFYDPALDAQALHAVRREFTWEGGGLDYGGDPQPYLPSDADRTNLSLIGPEFIPKDVVKLRSLADQILDAQTDGGTTKIHALAFAPTGNDPSDEVGSTVWLDKIAAGNEYEAYSYAYHVGNRLRLVVSLPDGSNDAYVYEFSSDGTIKVGSFETGKYRTVAFADDTGALDLVDGRSYAVGQVLRVPVDGEDNGVHIEGTYLGLVVEAFTYDVATQGEWADLAVLGLIETFADNDTVGNVLTATVGALQGAIALKASRPTRKVFGVDAGWEFGAGYTSTAGKSFALVEDDFISLTVEVSKTTSFQGNVDYLQVPIIKMPQGTITGTGYTSMMSSLAVRPPGGSFYTGQVNLLVCAESFGFGQAEVTMSTNNPVMSAPNGDNVNVRDLDATSNLYSLQFTLRVPRSMP